MCGLMMTASCVVMNMSTAPEIVLNRHSPWLVTWLGGMSIGPKGSLFRALGVLRWEEISSDFTTIEPRELKLDPVLLNYRSPWSGSGPAAFRHYDVAQLNELYETSRKNNAQPLTNAIVLVSYYGAGLGDVGTTSLAANQPRVLLHSTALDDLMQRNWLRRSPRWVDALAILSLILLGALATLFRGTLSAFVVLDCGRGGRRRSQRALHHQGRLGSRFGEHKRRLEPGDVCRTGQTAELRIHATP